MEELLEAITWRQLKLAAKPIVLLNTLGYYDNLVAMFDHAINQGFMKKSHQRLWALAKTPAEALDIIANELEHEPEPFESKY